MFFCFRRHKMSPSTSMVCLNLISGNFSIYFPQSCVYFSRVYNPLPCSLAVRELFPLPSCLFARGLSPLLCLFVWIIRPLPSCLFFSGLSPPLLYGWFLGCLVYIASFVINSGILLTGVLTFWDEFIVLCLGVFFSVTLWVKFNGLLIVD